MPVLQIKVWLLVLCLGLIPAYSATANQENPAGELQGHQEIQADSISGTEVDQNRLALNNAVPVSEPTLKEVVAEKGPVLLVPLVLVVLALVAVSRRKEHH